jgi:hypothetical protein
VGELGDDVGAGRFLALLPLGNVLLRLADEASELGLAQARFATERGETSALRRTWLLELARHPRSVGPVF